MKLADFQSYSRVPQVPSIGDLGDDDGQLERILGAAFLRSKRGNKQDD